MKKILEIAPTWEREYTMSDEMYQACTEAFYRYRLLYPRGSFSTFIDSLPKIISKQVRIKKFKPRKRDNGAKIEIVSIDEMIEV